MPEQTPNSRDTHINPTTEQVPHSGVHGHELPPHDFDMNLPDALEAGAVHHVELDAAGNPVFDLPDTLADFSEPANSPKTEAYEPLLAPVKENKHKRRIAAMAAGAVLIGGYGAVKLFGSDNEATTPPDNRPTASASPNPEQVSTPEVLTVEQERRAALAYETHYIDLVDFDGFMSDPIDGANYVDQEGVRAVVQGFMNNMVLTAETGNEDGLRATFLQNVAGDYSDNQPMVDAIRADAAENLAFQEQDPSYPLKNMYLESIVSVQPDVSGPDRLSTTVTVLTTDHGPYTEGQPVEELVSREKWDLYLVRADSVGWEDGATRETWLIDDMRVYEVTPQS